MPEGDDTWESTDRGPYIKAYSGRKIFLADPRPEDYSIGDIARHLAGINRYSGGSRYTVAQHCVVAAYMAERWYPEVALLPARMLAHDADEAFYGDVTTPLKSLLPQYRDLEDRAQLAMESFFDIQFIGDPLVHEVDKRMYLTERSRLFGDSWGSSDYTGTLEPFWLNTDTFNLFEEWPADEAEAMYLATYRRLITWHQ